MARVRRSDPGGPGIRRIRSGRGFRYLGPDGLPVDAESKARVAGLVIPPAWQDVWISPDPRGHIQAVGTDAAGRRQYVYHDEWRAMKDRLKYERSLELAGLLPAARRRVTSELRGPDPSRERALAAAFRLLDVVAPRIGGERYVQLHGSHGLATLLGEHVTVSPNDAIRLCFPGKSGQEWEAELVDHDLARVLRSMKRGSGENLLSWREGRIWRSLSTDEINADVHERLGDDFSAKDFRTLRGGVVSSQALARRGVADTKTGRKQAVVSAVRETAEVLGNTTAIARSSYIDPRIIDLYLDGVVAKRARGTAGERALRALLT